MKNFKTIALFVTTLLSASPWAATITGRVTNTNGGGAIPGAAVTLTSYATNPATVVGSTNTDASGNYSFANAPTGLVLISVSLTGYTPNPSTTTTTVNSSTSSITQNFTLAGVVSYTGTSTIGGVITRSGVTVVGAKCVLRARTSSGSNWVSVDSTVTDANGVYKFTNCAAAGSGYSVNGYSLVVTQPGYASYTSSSGENSSSIRVDAGATVSFNVALTTAALATGTITGTVRNAATMATIAGASVSVTVGASTYSATSNASGVYTIANTSLVTGTYSVTASVAGYITMTNTGVAVTAGGTTTSNFNLTLIPASVHPSAAKSNIDGLQFTRMGDRLLLNLDVSSTARAIRIYDMNGTLRNRIAVPAGALRVEVPASFDPKNGFLFQVK